MLKSKFRAARDQDLMHRILFPKATLLFLTVVLFTAAATAQDKAENELLVTKCWSYPIESGKSLTQDGTRVYLGTTDARVEALSLDGKKLWATELGGDIASNLLATDAGVLVATASAANGGGQPSASLRMLSRNTGITGWSAKLPATNLHFLADARSAVVVVSSNGVIQSLDVRTGAVKWKREIAAGFAGEPYFSGDRIIVASTSNQIFIVSPATGEIESMRKLKLSLRAASESPLGEVITGDERGNVMSLPKGSDRPLWKYKTGGSISSIRAVNGHLLVTSHDNFAYYLTLSNGGLAWKKRFAGRVANVGIFEGALALISSFEEHGATFISLVAGKAVGQIAFNDDEFIAAGPVFSNSLILVLTNKNALAYSLNGCAAKKEAGTGGRPLKKK